MNPVPVGHALTLAAMLFALGLGGVLARRSVLFILLSLEIMLNAAALAFVAAGQSHADVGGQVMLLSVLAVAAAEVALGLALIVRLNRQLRTLDADAVDQLRD